MTHLRPFVSRFAVVSLLEFSTFSLPALQFNAELMEKR